MDIYLTELVRYLLAQSWQIAVLTIAVGLMVLALRHRTAHVRYLLWLIVLAKCLVPPLCAVPLRVLPENISLTIPDEMPATEPPAVERARATPMAPAPASPADRELAATAASQTDTVAANPAEESLSPIAWAGLIWIAGVSLHLTLNLLRALRGRCWLGRRRRALSDAMRQDIEAVLSTGTGGAVPAIWVVDDIGQPFVWGLVRGSIYVPTSFLRIEDAAQRRHVLAHELAHVQRLDSAVNLLQTIAQGLFWFHPFVWWVNMRIRHEREKCCDETAVAQLGAEARDYCHAVVETLARAETSSRPLPSLAVAGPAKNLEKRIKTMLRPGKRFYRRPSHSAAIGVALVALATVPTTLILSTRTRAENTAALAESTTAPREDVAADDGPRHTLPEGWALKYDDGITGGGNAMHWPAGMAHDLVSLEVVSAPLRSHQDGQTDRRYEFRILSAEEQEVGTITVIPHVVGDGPEPTHLPNRMTLRPGVYTLRYRREGGKHPDNFWMWSGPFKVDLSNPGMYALRFAPELGQARITGALGGCYALNFEKMGPTGVPLTGTVYQYPPQKYTVNGLPPGRYRLSAVTQRDGDNVFVSQADVTITGNETVTVDMSAPPRGTCSLKGKLRGKPRQYETPWRTTRKSSGKWYVLIRDPGSAPVRQTTAYEARTIDSRYVIRGSNIIQESEDAARYSIAGIAAGEYTVTAIEHPSFAGCTIQRQQSKPLIIKAGEEAVLDFDLGSPVVPEADLDK